MVVLGETKTYHDLVVLQGSGKVVEVVCVKSDENFAKNIHKLDSSISNKILKLTNFSILLSDTVTSKVFLDHHAFHSLGKHYIQDIHY